jgi:hypothetical protein
MGRSTYSHIEDVSEGKKRKKEEKKKEKDKKLIGFSPQKLGSWRVDLISLLFME